MAEEPKLPTRSAEFGIGKRIGGSVYVHRRYEDVLGDVVRTAKRHLPDGFDYTIIKVNQQTSNVSFIQSPDFDEADEPSVGDSFVVYLSVGMCRLTQRYGADRDLRDLVAP